MSNLEPFRVGGASIDLSQRVRRSATVAASPSAASETTIATVTVPGGIQFGLGVLVIGYAAFTVGASGTGVTMRIRQTDTSGTIIKASGASTVTAGNLYDRQIAGIDTSPGTTGQVYVLTMTVAAGAAASTVSAVELVAIAI